MVQVVSMVNQKGGVGKTTSSVNLAGAMALRNHKTLLIDMDPQGNASRALSIQKETKKERHGIYEVLCSKVDIKATVQSTDIDGLFLIPSSEELSGLSMEIAGHSGWEFLLRDRIQELKADYDYIFIDCPPSLGPLTVNVLVASSRFVVPLQCEYYALEGLSQLIGTAQRVKKHLNPKLELKGILLTMFDGRNRLSRQIETEVRKYFEDKVFQTIVPRNVRLSEAPGFGKSIFQYDPSSQGARSYYALGAEFEKRA